MTSESRRRGQLEARLAELVTDWQRLMVRSRHPDDERRYYSLQAVQEGRLFAARPIGLAKPTHARGCLWWVSQGYEGEQFCNCGESVGGH